MQKPGDDLRVSQASNICGLLSLKKYFVIAIVFWDKYKAKLGGGSPWPLGVRPQSSTTILGITIIGSHPCLVGAIGLLDFGLVRPIF